ncbi:fumarylacetoacetate hydrolase family protein [Pseudomonas putida]|uniref:fumarylacetoacetate hydrolase family protein n=1 Tax=Pseudomonas putida TaxID=303 RepID=UPI001F3FBD46|nr:fumarylacetoacetate hydrolase family protein [Pseudomonas putida]
MKLATFQFPDMSVGVGLIISDGIVDLHKHLKQAPRNMIDLIEAWSDHKPQLEQLVAQMKADIPLDAVRLLSPIPRPGKILGIGLNYADHVAEAGMETPDSQLWFAKMPTATNVPIGTIELPKVSEQLDYEAELAFVIGKHCRNVSRADAADVIFGYCVANDVSVRDWQLRTSQFLLGKSFDTHAPFGPWIVTPDEIGDPHTLDIQCLVNGEVRQKSNTEHLIFDCYAQIEHLSKVMTLEPGDIILTGTPGGVGIGFKPPRWLKAGDVVEVSIDRIGSLNHTVVPEVD